MAETILESKIFGLSLERVDAETFMSVEGVCRELTNRKDLIHYSSYKLNRSGLEGVLELKEKGLKVVAVTNASIPM